MTNRVIDWLLRGAFALFVVVLVAVPLAALLIAGLSDGPAGVVRSVSDPIASRAIGRTLWTAALMSLVNAVMGTATAWILVRHRFPGRGLLSALVDLPFAIPTLVTGIMIVLLFGPQEPLGAWLAAHGTPIAFGSAGIVLALTFVSLPFVVRAVEPVLQELDRDEEAAAETMGASRFVVFRRVILPAIGPAIAYGSLQAFGRALGEFGSIVVVSGNIPYRTLTAPVLIFGEVEAGEPGAAAAISVALLALSLALFALTRWMRARMRGAVV
jgi:sulfate/thiosulfate transport system permease protein